jgi:hypothetical protein
MENTLFAAASMKASIRRGGTLKLFALEQEAAAANESPKIMNEKLTLEFPSTVSETFLKLQLTVRFSFIVKNNAFCRFPSLQCAFRRTLAIHRY